jgi:hypothetical protein
MITSQQLIISKNMQCFCAEECPVISPLSIDGDHASLLAMEQSAAPKASNAMMTTRK